MMLREEVDLKRLLRRCEALAEQGITEDSWRLKKFVEKAEELLTELKTKPGKPESQALLAYSGRIKFLKGMLEVSTVKSNPLEKAAVIAAVPNYTITEDTKNIYHAEVQKVNEEIRENLFSKKSELRLRRALPEAGFFSHPADTADPNSPEDAMDMDALLKYNHSVQEKIADNMLSLVKNLKEQSVNANAIVRDDTKRVEDSALLADKNIVDLKKNSDKLQEHTKSNWQCWTWLLLFVVFAIFIGMVFLMKIFKKKK